MGRLRPDRDWSENTLFDVTYQPDAMTIPELEAGCADVLQRVYADDATPTAVAPQDLADCPFAESA